MARMIRWLVLSLLFCSETQAQRVLPKQEAPQNPKGIPTFTLAFTKPITLVFLEQSQVVKELDLTPEQKAELNKLLDGWESANTTYSDLEPEAKEKTRTHYLKATTDFLVNHLKPKQYDRLTQLMFQHRMQQQGKTSALLHVSKELQLQATQFTELIQMADQRIEETIKILLSGERYSSIEKRVNLTNDDYYEKMTEMLTKEQMEKLNQLQGNPVKLALHFDTKERPVAPMKQAYLKDLFGVYYHEIHLLNDAEIQKELQLTPNQITKARDNLGHWTSLYDLRTVTNPKALRTEIAKGLSDSTEVMLPQILQPAQHNRLTEIALQIRYRESNSDLSAICAYPGMATKIGLTFVQLQELEKGSDAKKILSEEQQKKALALLGKAYDKEITVDHPLKPKPLIDVSAQGGDVRYSIAAEMMRFRKEIGLRDEQLKRLQAIEEDYPKILNLIRKEFDYPLDQHLIGGNRGTSGAVPIVKKYEQQVKEESLKTLDRDQLSLWEQKYSKLKGR